MVSCVACDLECGDVERLETHWEQSHPSLAELNRSIERIRRQVCIVHCPPWRHRLKILARHLLPLDALNAISSSRH